MAKTTHLYELIPAEKDRQKAAERAADEAVGTFGKSDRFEARTQNIEHYNEDDKNADELVSSDMTTTAIEKLTYVERAFRDWYDVLGQKEYATAEATADLVVGSNVLATAVPLGLLMTLEHRMGKIGDVLRTLPTLEPGVSWQPVGDGTYEALNLPVRKRTRKSWRSRTIAPATEHHPEQVREWSEDIPVANVITTLRSGKIPTAQKAAILERYDALMEGIKRARTRASKIVAPRQRLGDNLLGFVIRNEAPTPPAATTD